jgi:activator-of-BECN1-regulated-autophagy protein 1
MGHPSKFSSLQKYRNISFSADASMEIIHFAEKCTVTKPRSCYLPLRAEVDPPSEVNSARGLANESHNAVSTIAIAFAPDGRTIASTHGDHTVKVSCCFSGRLIRSLVGHLRTPWTVKYHPKNPNIIASGCLGFQVRIWDWNYRSKPDESRLRKGNNPNILHDEYDAQHRYEDSKGVCLYTLNLQDSAIISVSFHPSGSILAIASGSILYLWDFASESEKAVKKWEESIRSSADVDSQTNETELNSISSSTNKYLPFNFKYTLRCVHFPPSGDTLIVGVANPPPPDHRGLGNKDKVTGFSLCLFNFDIKAAFYKVIGSPKAQSDILTNVRKVIPRVLLYNDGGFDISYDGKTLCACAEYLLPYGKDSIMDMPEHQKDAESDEDSTDDMDDDIEMENARSTFVSSPPRGLSSTPIDTLDQCMTPPQNTEGSDPSPPPCPPQGTLRRFALEAAQERRLRMEFVKSSTYRASGSIINQLESAVQSRLVPHIVTINIDPLSPSKKFGQLLQASPLSETKAPGVTCVKFSPSTEFCLIGFGVRDKENITDAEDDNDAHPVLSIYRCKGKMTQVATAYSCDDDVNIALFHPSSGNFIAYGTKQGRLKVLGTVPWLTKD